MRIARRLFLAAPALLLGLLLLVAGPVAAQDAAVEGVAPATDEIAAGARAKEAAVLAAELGQLRAKISALEQNLELKTKNDAIGTLDVIVKEKSQKIATMQNEVTSLEAKGSLAAEEQASKANARAIELEKQTEKLKKDITEQKIKKAALEARAGDADKKVQELNTKLEKLQKTSSDQKRRIQKTEHALKVAEEELMKVQLEATTKAKQLGEVHGAWLPPWLVTHAAHSMEVMSNHWNEHGKPAFDSLLQKASEKSAQAKKWAEPHLETAKTKWMPVAKEKWVILNKNAKPYVQMVSEKSLEVYQTSSDFIRPHLVNAHQVADPYFQKAKKLSKPYIDQIATATKPHVEKIRTTLKPYTKRARHVYGQFLETATTYHQQAQATISDYLHQHEFTKQFVTEELVWYLASALLVMPVFVLYTLLTETFGIKRQKKKTSRSSNANHGHRRHKRRHADK
ncbi:WEB family protein At3g02930, chloroplastic-like isoform X3 [Miscanthus floridulus]|uniref:WEB family protein At3g02930, chloroplastic-like isoform X3 n=1 Tax=Miscanthus floridulus TaxID=154761 RepID=UPI003457E066